MFAKMSSVYAGPTRDGLRHGDGVLQMTGYITYEGAFVDGRRHGVGRLLFRGGADGFIEGTFVHGELIGHARREWPDGRVYEGALFNGEMCGEGILSNPAKARRS